MLVRRRNVCKRLAWLVAIVAIVSGGMADAAEPIPLRAGPLHMVFDADNVFLRYLNFGSHEVLRGINAPIRDQNWATIKPEVSNLHIQDLRDSFRVTFDVRCHEGDIDFRWKGKISGTANGDVEFTFDGEAHSTFKRNRIGFCVLHGPSAAGRPWVLESSNGSTSKGQFPTYISPHQPAKNLRAITHHIASDLRARVEFTGDIFEMEDQRNWTDASFKTYCTPLEIPYPVEVVQGAKISQKIKIRILADNSNPPAGSGDLVLTVREKQLDLPRLGLQVSLETDNLTAEQEDRLRALNLDHLRVDLSLSDPAFVRELRRATKQAKALGASLQVGLHLGESPAFDALRREVQTLKPPVSYWLVTGGDPAEYSRTRNQLQSVLGESKLGVSRVTNFVDLNRARPADRSIEAVGFAINPQIHAFDNASMVETLPIHADVVRSARRFAGDQDLVIGPITLRPQWVNGEDPPGGPPQGGPLPTYVDARQPTQFAAAWTLGSLKYLTDGGAHSATFYETVGWNGVMDIDFTALRPKAYPSQPGKVFPVYHLLRGLGDFAGGRASQIDSSNKLAAVGIVLQKSGHRRLLVGNLTGKDQTLQLRGLDGPFRISSLDGRDTRQSSGQSLKLPPYGVSWIDPVAK